MIEATALKKKVTRCATCAIECEKMVKGGARIDWHDSDAWFCCQRCHMVILNGVRPANVVNGHWSLRAQQFQGYLTCAEETQHNSEQLPREAGRLASRPTPDTDIALWSKFLDVARNYETRPLPVHGQVGRIGLTDNEWIDLSKRKLSEYYVAGECDVKERRTLEQLIDLAVA